MKVAGISGFSLQAYLQLLLTVPAVSFSSRWLNVASLSLGRGGGSLEVRGLEPLTYSLQSYRSTN